MRIVHYVNQFFAGIGGEDAAGTGPELRDGAVGPGRKLACLLGDEHEIVATAVCGDDYAASHPEFAAELVALARERNAELIVAGPAFTSGRYGIACARIAAAASEAGLLGLAAMHPENPGVGEAAGTSVVESGLTARQMKDSLERFAAAARKLAAGEELTAQDGRIGPVARINRLAEHSAAERAVALVLTRLGGDRDATEIPLPDFDSVTPAAPIADAAEAVFALVTEGGFVPVGNPDRLESARASKWVRYSLDGIDSAESGRFMSVHGGFSTQWANADPNRILPLDVAREMEREGTIGRLHGEVLATTGNGTTVADARRFGMEWAAELRQQNIQAAILTAT
ncbi:MAG TPA: glycine/betaine/sarcosine/D-proline family reductase selenoprotein B [Solirubrobacteraceae bacterium]|nr:glycine/betaine/sarcosine/D-proline family reductase selenoprotein B [Solirubrobacteraceae bacterium]